MGRRIFHTLTLLGLILAGAWALNAQAAEGERCSGPLPPAIAAKRSAILAAAQKKDLAALHKLASPVEFTFSYGDDSDAVAYWRGLAKDGVDIGHIASAILGMGCVMGEGGSYVWPSAAMIDWAQLSAAEQKALVALYGRKIDEYWLEGRNKGYYVGWRITIEPDGSWSSFVAGD